MKSTRLMKRKEGIELRCRRSGGPSVGGVGEGFVGIGATASTSRPSLVFMSLGVDEFREKQSGRERYGGKRNGQASTRHALQVPSGMFVRRWCCHSGPANSYGGHCGVAHSTCKVTSNFYVFETFKWSGPW